jgi:hypothetical protein
MVDQQHHQGLPVLDRQTEQHLHISQSLQLVENYRDLNLLTYLTILIPVLQSLQLLNQFISSLLHERERRELCLISLIIVTTLKKISLWLLNCVGYKNPMVKPLPYSHLCLNLLAILKQQEL